jgi:Mrp family chromosome partitioning ATPase
VTWGGKTHKKLVEKARDELNKYPNIRLLGVVLNKVDMKKNGYGYYPYSYYKYPKGYGDRYKTKTTKKKEVKDRDRGTSNFLRK